MVKIYIYELPLPISDKLRSSLLSRLDRSEIKMLPKQIGMNFDLSCIGMILAKKIVSEETHIPKTDVLIGKTKFGKPIIRKPRNITHDISISHSGKLLVIGISNSGKIGVDIEFLNNIDYGIYRNCLSVSEEKYINKGKDINQRLKNFYEIWTRKESYLKALGIGLQKPLPITQFYSDHLEPKSEINNDNQLYYFSTIKENKFVLSLCNTGSSLYSWKYIKLSRKTFGL